MIRSQKGNITLCASDSFILRSLDFYFDDLLKSLSKALELTGKKLAVHAYSCHMLNTLIHLNLDKDECDAVILITTHPCYRILKGLYNYTDNVFYIDIDSANSVILQKLNTFILRTIAVSEGAKFKLTGVDDLLYSKVVLSYFHGISPSFIEVINGVSQSDISKTKRKLMDAFLVRTTQELYIKHQLYHKAFIRYNF
ncbi:hypothetical protein EJE24_22670 [Enterobacter huaxiensis]|uniref:Uncharacterized protein n=1 Tax=Enterobacter huaxiensis TaxID=2494702 RepID=A0A428LGR4_9ENTR|nr:hypothetical protein [Enterobacter huaxiensis]RSK63153.1 hypothetical protein EJE24_22670 [Enterobacter huaxiensis]